MRTSPSVTSPAGRCSSGPSGNVMTLALPAASGRRTATVGAVDAAEPEVAERARLCAGEPLLDEFADRRDEGRVGARGGGAGIREPEVGRRRGGLLVEVPAHLDVVGDEA